MKKFVALYRSTLSAKEQVMELAPERAKATMAAWMSWGLPGPYQRVLVRPGRVARPGEEHVRGAPALRSAGRLDRTPRAAVDAWEVSRTTIVASKETR